jgi:Mrp family chromosome partitioning ATPase
LAKDYAGVQPAAILVLGADAGEHPALVARGIARQLAEQADGEVLLLDANLANRELTAQLGMENQPGLAEILTQSCRDDDPLIQSASPNLWVLPAGQDIVLRPTNLDEFIPALLGELRLGRRWLVVHGGLAESALTKTLARHCDGVYVAIRLGQTIPDEAADVIRLLQANGAHVRGCIATNAPARRT